MGFIKAVLSLRKRRGRTIWYWKRVANKPLRIDFTRLPNNHMVITGASGMGKSLLAKNIVLQLYTLHGYGFLIIDPHGEYADLAEIIPGVNIVDASTVSLNPLELEGQDPGHRAHELSYTIQSLFNLGHLQRQIIEDLIMEAYRSKGIYPDNPGSWGNKPPSFNDLLAAAEAAATDNDLVRRIIPYLRILSSRIFSSTSMGFSEIVSKPTIIQLNKLSSDYIRSLYIDTLLHKLIASMYKKRGKRLIVVIDEAHLVFRRSPGRRAVSKLLMESRKYGLGFIIISQQPLSLSDTVFQNTSIRISFNTGEPRNAEYAARLHALSGDKSKINAVKEAVSSLKPHEYLLSTINTRFPVIVDSKELKTIINGSLTTITGSENKRLTGS
jgi:DNA helicase HerA-like ATPase